MKKIILVSLIAVNSVAAFAQKVKSTVDGRIYAITLTEDGKKKPEPIKDEMTFMPQGKFKSNYMLQASRILPA